MIFLNNIGLLGVVDVSTIPNLTFLTLINDSITGVTGLNLCSNIDTVQITDTNITQSAADSIANQLNATGKTGGSLFIASQTTGTINISGAIYDTLRGKNWTIS